MQKNDKSKWYLVIIILKIVSRRFESERLIRRLWSIMQMLKTKVVAVTIEWRRQMREMLNQ